MSLLRKEHDVLRTIEDHFHDQQFCVSRLADLHEISTQYLDSYCGNRFNKSPVELIYHRRARTAFELHQSGLAYSKISNHVGVSSINTVVSMCRHFANLVSDDKVELPAREAESREPRAESREPRAESRDPRSEIRDPRSEIRDPSKTNKKKT